MILDKEIIIISFNGLLIYHLDISDQRKPQGYISHIALTTGRYLNTAPWLGRYHDVALTTTAFDAEVVTKHQFT